MHKELAITTILMTALLFGALWTQGQKPKQETCPVISEELVQKCYKPYGAKDWMLAYQCAEAACNQIDENVAEQPPCVFEMTTRCQQSGKIPIPDIQECKDFKENKQKILDCLEEET